MHWKEDPFAMHGIDIVQQVVACVIQDHTNGTERDAGGSELKRHLDDRALLVQVFERSEGLIVNCSSLGRRAHRPRSFFAI